MTKTNRARLIKCVALILPLILIFGFAQGFLFDRRSYDTDRIEKFYQEEANSLDVVLMGASEVTQGYIPGYAYEKYGYTSYKYTLDANQGSLFLSQLKEILKYQNPEILFVDLGGFLNDDATEFFNRIILLNYSSCIPLSENKFRTIMEYPDDEKLCYFFPLIMHHGNPSVAYDRLSEVYYRLTKDAKPAPLKGALAFTKTISKTADVGEPFDPATYALADESKACLVEFLDYCKTNELNVVFTNFPRNIADESNHNLLFLFQQAKAIVEQSGYPVWDLQKEMELIGIDANEDFIDPFHMNIYGQTKLTDYIGNAVIKKYGLVPRAQSEGNQLGWEDCVSNTRDFIKLATTGTQSGKVYALYDSSHEWLYRK